MNSDTLRRLMGAARHDPETVEGREAFAKALGVDERSVRRWLSGANFSKKSVGYLRSYRPRSQVARAAVDAFWQQEDARNVAAPPTTAPSEDSEALADTSSREQDTSEVTGEAASWFATVKNGLEALALTVKNGLDTLTGMVQGLSFRVDSQTTQDAQDRAKLAELGTEMGQLQAQADALKAGVGELKTGMQGLRAKTDELGQGVKGIEAKTDELGKGVKGLDAKTSAHHEQTGRWILALGGIMVAGFAGVIVTVVACAHAGGPIPGAGQTRGGGVAAEAARQGQQTYGSLDSGIDGGTGERKTGRPMPHSPLPHQRTGTCPAGITKLFNACWLKAADQQPPCLPEFFEYDNACYLPIAADPNVPVGTEPKRSGQKVPREQNDAGMPGKSPE